MGNDIGKHTRETIINRRDSLLRERRQIRDERQKLSMRDRMIDRELADCRAAARLFNLDIEFPPDEQEEFMRIRAIESRLLNNAVVRQVSASASQPVLPLSEETETVPLKRTSRGMPRIRDIVLDRVRDAGDKGSKALPIKLFIESTYGVELHYKTIGMTLYRLSKEGLVRREGQKWFFVPQNSETKNPGASTPGLINRR